MFGKNHNEVGGVMLLFDRLALAALAITPANNYELKGG